MAEYDGMWSVNRSILSHFVRRHLTWCGSRQCHRTGRVSVHQMHTFCATRALIIEGRADGRGILLGCVPVALQVRYRSLELVRQTISAHTVPALCLGVSHLTDS